MAFRNLTPLHCLPFEANTPEGGRNHVVVVKLTLDLVPIDPADRAGGFTHRLKLAQAQVPVRPADTSGDPPHGGVREESELAPGKPRCDLLVLGDAHAPGGKARRRFQARLRLLAPDQARPAPERPLQLHPDLPLAPEQERDWQARAARARADPIPGRVLLDKRLQCTGERWLRRRNVVARALGWLLKLGTLGLVRRCPWRLTRPRPAAAVPLRYEFSFGGQVRVEAGTPAFGRVARRHWLPDVDRDALRRAGSGLLAQDWFPANPVGCGFAPAWYCRAARAWRLPAPRIEDPRRPVTAKAAWRAMVGKPGALLAPELQPQGMAVIGRSWTARLRGAGTWDQAWAESGRPYPPDFQPAFWNCAHPDLQGPLLEGDEVLELTNLCAADLPGAGRDARGDTVLRFRLPGLLPYLRADRETGGWIRVPARLDTVTLEPGAARVTLVQRAVLPVEEGLEALELRLDLPG